MMGIHAQILLKCSVKKRNYNLEYTIDADDTTEFSRLYL